MVKHPHDRTVRATPPVVPSLVAPTGTAMDFSTLRLLRRVAPALALLTLLLPGRVAALEPRGAGVDMNTNPPAWCFTFDRLLRSEGMTPGDFVQVDPPADLSVTVRETRLCLQGLPPGNAAEVTVRPGLPAADGTLLASPVSATALLPDLPPVVRMTGSGFVLPAIGSAGLGIETVNVARVRVRVLRVDERLVSRKEFDRDPQDHMIDYLTGSDARQVWIGEMDIAAQPNRRTITAIPLEKAVTDGVPGVFAVFVEDAALPAQPTDRWDRDREGRVAGRWLIRTDLAPTLMLGGDGLTVVLRSLAGANAVAGARAVLVARDNGILGEATTGRDGIARFAPGLVRGKGAAQAKSLMIHGPEGDFAFVDLDRPAFDFSDRGAECAPHRGALDAFVWTERGIYRPGETVHAGVLLRDRQMRAVEGAAVTLVLRRPDGVEMRRETVRPQAGGATMDFTLGEGARRGGWTLTALLEGGTEPLGEAGFEVEDFVPPRLKVSVDPPAPELTVAQGGTVTLPLTARFLYGAPGSGLAAGGTAILRDDPRPFPDFADFSFGLKLDADRFSSAPLVAELPVTETDAEGRAVLAVPVPRSNAGNRLPMRLDVVAEVREPGGRATRDRVSVPVRDADLWLGARMPADGVVPRGKDLVLDVVAVDRGGRPVAVDRLEWTIERIDEDYFWYTDGLRWRWSIHKRSTNAASGVLSVGTDAPARLTHALPPGRYGFHVRDPATGAVVGGEFHVGWYFAGDADPTPDRATVKLDRPAARPGETVRVQVDPPFAGMVQMVVASDRVHRVESATAGTGPVTFDVKVDGDWGAGAYAMVTVIRPVGSESGRSPVRAVGLAWIGVDASDRRLEVAVEAPEKVRPRQRVDIPVRVAGGQGRTFLTLAAVDMGILDLTRHPSPDPFAYFRAKRRLGVEVRDLYGRLLDGNAGPAGQLRQGGDGELGGAGLPVSSSRVVSLFSGMVEVVDGRAVVPLEVPDFAGGLRLMAVAWDKERVGAAQAEMLVRDPVVAEVVLPRFLAPGDEAQATLLLHNLEGPVGDYTVSLAARGPLELTGAPAAPVTLAAGQRMELPLGLRGGLVGPGADMGVAGVSLDLSGPDGISAERGWDLTVRPAQTPLVLTELRQQAPGEPLSLSRVMLEPFQPGTVSISATFSRLPGIDVPGLLADLDRYPYGCTEQTVSVAMPLLAFPDAAAALGLEGPADVAKRIDHAIARLMERRGPRGDIGLWTAGDGLSDPWLQAYVLDFLQRARRAGHEVPKTGIEDLEKWVEHVARGTLSSGPADVEAAIYGLWLLARSGKAPAGDLRWLSERLDKAGGWAVPTANGGAPPEISSTAHAQLGAALALVGDNQRAAAAFARARAALGSKGSDFYASAERDVAATLAVAAEAGDQETVTAAAERLRSYIETGEYWRSSTQEKAWQLLAAQMLLRNSDDAEIHVDGASLKTVGATVGFSATSEQVARGVVATNTGSSTVWRSVVLRGVPAQSPPAEASGGMRLERRFHTLSGEAVDPTTLSRHSRFIVVLEGRYGRDLSRRSVVVVNPLPAGWEIESVLQPTGTQQGPLAWIGELSQAPVKEARDDRFVAMEELNNRYYDYKVRREPLEGNAFRFAFIVRAVTPGSFALPPATAEDMYDSKALARTDSGRVVVTGGP